MYFINLWFIFVTNYYFMQKSDVTVLECLSTKIIKKGRTFSVILTSPLKLDQYLGIDHNYFIVTAVPTLTLDGYYLHHLEALQTVDTKTITPDSFVEVINIGDEIYRAEPSRVEGDGVEAGAGIN